MWQTCDILKGNYALIEEKIGYVFRNKDLIFLAFTHRSYANESKGDVRAHNERLEFLGDAVLDLIVSDYLYRKLPDHSEGDLSYLRSRIVEGGACAGYVGRLGIEDFVLMGKGELLNEGRGRNTIHSDLFEALIGAIYMDGGIEAAESFFFRYFETDILNIIEEPLANWKAKLQDFSQKKYRVPPEYRVVNEEGPDHEKIFHVTAVIDGREVGKGIGSSKKEAEQQAAEDAVSRVGL